MSPGAVERALGLLPQEVGPALIALPEDQWFDRKSARIKSRALGDVLVGFGNADGGVVVIGVAEGVVEGVDQLGGRLNDLMQAHLDHVVPPVRTRSRLVDCVDSAGRPNHLLVLDIGPSDGVVHTNARDDVFLRVGDENRRLSFAQRQELVYDRGHDTYEAHLLRGTHYGDLDDVLLDQYAEALAAPDPLRLLVARGLGDGVHLTVAGCLLFARHPQSQLPEAYIRVLRYIGTERGSGARQRLIDDERIEGPIPRALIAARMTIDRLQPVRRALTSSARFERVPLVPEDAWIEGLVNAAVHRSYSLAGDHIRVEIFDDRIEISSPGRFPGLVDLNDPLNAPRFARNPRIARVCADLQFGQELGEGIRRIYEEMRLAGLQDPVYKQSAASVHLTLSGEPVDRQLDAQLTPDARAASVALRDAGRLSTGEIAEVIGRSRPHVLSVLRSLEDAGIVRWVGKSKRDPRAYWEIVRR